MLLKKALLGASVALTALLAACGGGTGAESGGTSSGLMTNSVVIGASTLKAGQSTPLSANAVMRGATPTSMTWSATPLFALSANDTVPLISDLNCAEATYAAPLLAGASGESTCQAIFTAPAKTASGKWRITNTAASPIGSVSNSVEVEIAALPASGFRLVESSTPLSGFSGKPLSLTMPFTVDAGATVTNVKYQWTVAAQSAAAVAISGSKNSTATVIPVTAGQYRFDVSVNADVNGFPETATGSVIATVYPPSYVDIIDAGVPQITNPGVITILSGSILNFDNTMVYSTSWRQLTGTAGGPVAVSLANTNSSSASFIAPTTIGTYGFEYKVVKRQPDGTDAITTAQTSVTIQSAPSGVFNVSAGDVQAVAIGAPTLLRGSVGTQGNGVSVTYSYLWSQIGSAPAAVAIANGTSETASFIPTAAGTYTFGLSVTATTTGGETTTVTGTTEVVASSSGVVATNFALSANAGPAQSVAPNAIATLAGSQVTQGSSTGVTYGYAWSQVGATPAVVTLSSANTATATFVPTVSGVYEFQLTVTATLADGSIRTATSNSQVIVGGMGNTFTVSAGDAQAVAINTAATMAGVISTQGTFSGASFSYAWSQIGVSPAAVLVSNATSLTASVVPTVTGTYTFELTVTAVQGGVSSTHTAQTQVLVTP